MSVRFQGYTVERVGRYRIVEGTGQFGGLWAAVTKGDFAVFPGRCEAKEHAFVSQDTD